MPHISDDEIILMAAYIGLRREAQSGSSSRLDVEIARARHVEAAHCRFEAELWGR